MERMENQDWLNKATRVLRDDFFPWEWVEVDGALESCEQDDKIDDQHRWEDDYDNNEMDDPEDFQDDSEYLKNLMPVDVFIHKARRIKGSRVEESFTLASEKLNQTHEQGGGR
jgi:hypothetical protein